MKTLLYLSIFLFVIYGFQNSATDDQVLKLNGKTIHVKVLAAQQARKYSFRPIVSKVLPVVKKRSGAMRLELFNGKYITLKDVTTGNDVDKKEYIFKELLFSRFYVVLGKYYETGEYLLIDRKNGDIVKLWGRPYFSPNNHQYVAAFSGSLDYDMMPNGIQLFKVDSDKISLEWEYIIEDWQPDGLAWKDNKTLLVIKNIPNHISPTKKTIKTYLSFEF
ncbi:MAG: hypothetical protein EOP47_03355 [Sphingobacteriaceae bacterium]|nr:MAG: hypothetical protein EOP47_03355 [Sphingobacteriaceae bacterium]